MGRAMGKPTRVIQLVICAVIMVVCASLWRWHSPVLAKGEDRTQEVAERALRLAREKHLAEDPAIAPLLARGPVLIDPIGTYSLAARDRQVPRAVPSYTSSNGQVLKFFSTIDPSKASTDIWQSLANDDAYCWAYVLEGTRVCVTVYRGRSAPETYKSKTEIEGGVQ